MFSCKQLELPVERIVFVDRSWLSPGIRALGKLVALVALRTVELVLGIEVELGCTQGLGRTLLRTLERERARTVAAAGGKRGPGLERIWELGPGIGERVCTGELGPCRLVAVACTGAGAGGRLELERKFALVPRTWPLERGRPVRLCIHWVVARSSSSIRRSTIWAVRTWPELGHRMAEERSKRRAWMGRLEQRVGKSWPGIAVWLEGHKWQVPSTELERSKEPVANIVVCTNWLVVRMR